ncbi:MAG: asparagine synthase (glutamine-hydrolyzing) [Sphingomonadales bacterium]
MCGIFVSTRRDASFHHRMLDGLKNRGPDALGFWSNSHVHMGHTRLSILGLHDDSNEPMENERYVLVYNGEIYNFIEIKHRLEAKGYHLKNANDSTVLLYAWTEWGEKILADLSGFWAFVLYDKRANKLILCRDQLGIKPLYYWHDENGICISSLFKTVLHAVDQKPDLNLAALSEYTRYQFTLGDKTFLNQIRKVLPGHIVEIPVESNQITKHCYEDILVASCDDKIPATQNWIDETRDLIRHSILESTISDTSFTTFCSGGLDSSFITRICEPEITYHCNFSDPDCNETVHARRAVEGLDTRLFVVNAVDDFDIVDKLDDIVSDFDELTIGSVIFPLDDLLAQVKRRYKVILTGTGGDELFAGYVRYALTMGQCNQDSYLGMFNRVRQYDNFAERFEECHRKGATDLYAFYDPGAKDRFLSEFDQCLDTMDNNPLSAMLRFDQRNFLAGLLNIDDKMGGRHSVESRPSLLHQKIVRHLQGVNLLPSLEGGDLKSVMREITEGILPRSIIYRKDKMGFTTPIGTFVNASADRIRETIMESRFKHFYNIEKINFTADTKFSREVFGLLILDRWLNKYM